MKKYKIWISTIGDEGYWHVMNVAPENEEMFLKEHANNKPTVIPPTELIFPENSQEAAFDFKKSSNLLDESLTGIPLYSPSENVKNLLQTNAESYLDDQGNIVEDVTAYPWSSTESSSSASFMENFKLKDEKQPQITSDKSKVKKDGYENIESMSDYIGGDYNKYLNDELDQIYTFKNANDWFEHKIENNLSISGDAKFDKKIIESIYNGTHGYNPYKKRLFRLSKSVSVPHDVQEKITNLTKEVNTPVLFWDENENLKQWKNASPEQKMDWYKKNDPITYSIKNSDKINYEYGKNNFDNLSYNYKLNWLRKFDKNSVKDFVENTPNPNQTTKPENIYDIKSGKITFDLDDYSEPTISSWETSDKSKKRKLKEDFINSNPDTVITYENNKEWIDHRSWVNTDIYEMGRDFDWGGDLTIHNTLPKNPFSGTQLADFLPKSFFKDYDNDIEKIRERNLQIYTGLYSGEYGYNPARDELVKLQNAVAVPLETQIFSTRFPKKHPDYFRYLNIEESTPRPVRSEWFELTESDALVKFQDNYYQFDFSFWQTGNREVNKDGLEVGYKNYVFGTPRDDQIRVVSNYTGKEIIIDTNLSDKKEIERQRQLLEDFIDVNRNPEATRDNVGKFESFRRRSGLTTQEVSYIYEDYNDAKNNIDYLKSIWGMENKSDAYILDLFTQCNNTVGWAAKYEEENPPITEGSFTLDLSPALKAYHRNERFPEISKSKAKELWDIIEIDNKIKDKSVRSFSDDVYYDILKHQDVFRRDMALSVYLNNNTLLNEKEIVDLLKSEDEINKIISSKEYKDIYLSDDLIIDSEAESNFVKREMHRKKELKIIEKRMLDILEGHSSNIWKAPEIQKDIKSGYQYSLDNIRNEIKDLHAKSVILKREMQLTLDELLKLEKDLVNYIDKHAEVISTISGKYNITTLEEFLSNESAQAELGKYDLGFGKIISEKEALNTTYLASLDLFKKHNNELTEKIVEEEDIALFGSLLGLNVEWGYANSTYALNGLIDLLQGLTLQSASAYLNLIFWIGSGFSGGKESMRTTHSGNWLAKKMIAWDDWLQETNFELDAFQHNLSSSTKPRMKPGEIENASDFFQYALEAISSQSSNITLNLVMPGMSSIKYLGASAGFNTYGDMAGATYMYFNPDVYKQYAYVYGPGYPQEFGYGEMISNGAWAAIWETGSEYAGMKVSIMPLKRILGKSKLPTKYNLKNEIFQKQFSFTNTGHGLMTMGKGVLIESGFEGANQLAQNTGNIFFGVNGAESYYDNVDVALLDAAIVSGSLQTTTQSLGIVKSYWTESSANEKLVKNAFELTDLVNKLPSNLKKYPNVGPVTKKVKEDGKIVDKDVSPATPTDKTTTVAGVEGTVGPPSYKINGKEVSRKEMIDHIVNNKDGDITIENDLQLSQLNNYKGTEAGKTMKKILDLLAKQDELLSTQVARVDLLTNEEKQKIIELTKQQFAIESKILEVRSDGSIPNDDKLSNLTTLTQELEVVTAKKDAIFNNYTTEDIVANFKKNLNWFNAIREKIKKMGIPIINVRLENDTKFKESIVKYETDKAGIEGQAELESGVSQQEAYEQALTEIINDETASKKDREWAEKELKKSQKDPNLWLNQFGNLLGSDITRYGVFQPRLDKNGNVARIDIIVNTTTAVKDGMLNTLVHEVSHVLFYYTLDGDPKLKQIFGDQIADIILSGKIKFKSDFHERTFWKRIASYDVEGFKAGKFNGDEMLAVLSEMLANEQVEFNMSWGQQIMGVFNRFAQNFLGYQFGDKFGGKFDNAKDIENYLKDIHRSLEGNPINPAIARMLEKGANGKLIDESDTYKFRKQDQEFSQAVNNNMKSNPDLKDEFDLLVQNEDGTLRWTNHADFTLSPEYIEGYNKIVDSKLLDGIIQQGMTAMGLPPEALKDFTRKVKEKIGERYLTNFSLDKNDSLFGWLTGASGGAGMSIIYRAKGDVINEYKKEGTNLQTSIDKIINESGATIGDVIEDTSQDEILQDLEDADLSPEAQNEIKEQIDNTYDGDLVEDILPDMGPVVELVDEKVDEANISLEGIKYKDIKNLLTGNLSGALKDISGVFKVDHLRLINKQDLNKKQRVSAQTWLYDFIVTSEGTLNPNFMKILPEGTDVDGNSTGVANTALKVFYIKGDRVTMAKTGSAAGNINWTKRDDVTLEEALDIFGINLDGSFRTGTKADGAIRELILQIGIIITNQSLKKKAIQDNIAEATITKSLDVGKSEQMFSQIGDTKAQEAYIDKLITTFNSIKNVRGARKILTKYLGKYKSFDREKTETYLNQKGIYKERNIYSWNKKMLQKFGKVFRAGEKIVGDKFANIIFQSNINGVSRTTIGTVGVWQKLFPNAEKGAAFEKKEYGKNNLSDGIKIDNNNKITINLFDKDLSVDDFRKMEIEQLELMADFLDFLKAGGKETAFLYEAVMSDAVHTMGSIIRNSALLSALPINDKGELDYVNGTIQEHMVPQNIITKLHLSIPNSADFVKVVKKVYGQMPLLKTHDDMVTDAGFKSSMPDIFYNVIIPRILKGELDWLPDGLGGIIRYTKSGIDLNGYISFETGKSIPEVFGLGFESFPNLKGKNRDIVVGLQNFYIDQILTGEMTRAKAKSEFAKAVKLAEVTNQSFSQVDVNIDIQQTFSQKIDNAINNKDVGISVYDADDTILRSKSGVIVRKTNDDGKPKPKRKVIFLAGSAGSGKSNVVKQLGLEDQGFKIVNQDISLEWLVKNSGLPTDMREFTPEQSSKWGSLQWKAREIAQRKAIKFRGNGDGVVVDGTGASTVSLFTQMQKFKDAGYDVQMIFVDSSLETALARNKARPERSLKDFIVERNWKAVQKNKKAFEEEFGDNFAYINTDNINIGDALPVEFTSQLEDFVSGYEITRLTSEEFANQGTELQEAGAEFDFSEFNKVIDGEPGPYLESLRKRIKKFGNKDVFILTARPQQSAFAIQQFLKGEGIDIPIENITGLANSDGNAKAEWMLGKYMEGYNNFFFVDDAWGNVDAVKKVLDQLDVKSDVVQAFSQNIKNLDIEFNKIIERKKGVGAKKVFSMAEARKRGAEPDILRSIKRLFIPPSAEDFKGLLYAFLGKGKQGNADMEFFNENLLRPFGKAIMAWNTFKHNMISDYKALKKNFPNVKLNKKVPGTSFTNDTAIRVYLWDKAGFDIPGISKKLKKQLIKHVNNDGDLKGFAEGLSIISKRKEGYIKPSEDWMVETIMSDLSNITDRVSRKEFLQEWIANKDIIFSEKNLNKIEAVYGNSFRYALDNILYRMENGTNRMVGDDKVVNWFTNWINNSVGAIMFFNMRSSLLQTMSTVNFINWSDNNLFEASKAFANQKQFWKDFVMLFNSPMLKQRRKGIKIDVSASELTKSFSEGGATPGNVLNHLLRLGFTPTQIADSFAIAFGGASFFRNRYNKYIKEGKSKKEAEEQAMLDFQEIAEETQQSSREDLISQQQASVLGRIVLAFQNVTMQYTRQTKKAMSDMINGRGDFKTNMSKIVYYGMVQNILFSALQTALLFYLFSGEEDENMEDRVFTVFNNSLDSFMRGTGLYGAMGSTVKNTYFEWQRQESLDAWKQDDWKIAEQVINLSPPIGSKVRKIISAWKTKQYNEDLSDELSWRIENPTLAMSASLIEAVFNVPTRRLLDKANNLEEAITGNHETWKRVMLAMGWNMWSLGIEDEEVVAAEQENVKQKKEEKQKEKEEEKRKEEEEKKAKGIKTVQCSGINSEGERCKNTIETDKKTWKCVHHAEFKEGSDTDGDGKKEYRCTAIKSDGTRCKNKTENKSKRCYAHPKAEILE